MHNSEKFTTINVSKVLRKKLLLLKIKHNKKSMNEVIKDLLKSKDKKR